MSAAARRAANCFCENHGHQRECGTERTSTTAFTPACWSSATKRSIGIFEWPMVKRSNAGAARINLHIHLQRCDEGLLRDVDLAELAHALLALFLFLKELALAGHVAAVALGGDVLAEGAHGFARDNLAANRRLDRHLKHVRRNELLQ